MMHGIYKAAGSFRASLSCFNTPERSAEKLDPLVRTALAEAIAHDTTDCRTECEQLEEELAHATAALKISMEKESFIHTRYKQYENLLERKCRELAQEKKNTDEETEADLQQRESLLEKEKIALEGVKQTHKEMLVQCEQMRRTVLKLEQKMARVEQWNGQCQSFVDRAATSTLELKPIATEQT